MARRFTLADLFHEAKGSSYFHSIDSVDNLISIENGYQLVHRSRGVARTGRNVFPKDASGLLDSPQRGVLIRLGHWWCLTDRGLKSLS
jgi:hypothetical protein